MADAPGDDDSGVRAARRTALERVAARISSLLVGVPLQEFHARVTDILRQVVEAAGAERGDIFRLAPGDDAWVHTHEWRAPHLPSAMGRLPPLPVAEYRWWMEALASGAIAFADTASLPPAAAAERRVLDLLGVKAGVVVPLHSGGRIKGFLGLGCLQRATPWSPEEINVVKITGQLLSSAFTQQERLQELRDSNALLEQAEQMARIGSWRWDAGSARFTWSGEMFRIFGQDRARFTPTIDAALARIHPNDREIFRRTMDQAAIDGRPIDMVVRLVHDDGAVRQARIIAEPLFTDDKALRGFVGTVQDITDAIRTRQSLRRANRALQAMSACNTALVRAPDEQQLLWEVCRIVVDLGGHRLAWIWRTGGAKPSYAPAAFAGSVPNGFFKEMAKHAAAGEELPFIKAARERSTVLVPDLRASDLPHKEWWLSLGIGSCIALPLGSGEQLFGVMAICGSYPGEFDEEEAAVLEQLATDLGYGIGALRSQRARDEAQHFLEATEESLRSVVEKEADGVLVLDRSARIVFANPAAQSMLGRTMEELQGETFAFPLVIGEMVEIEVLRPDGTRATAEMRAAETEWYKIPALVVALHDVTQQRKAQAELRIWATVLEHSGELIFVTDSRKQIIAVNNAFEKITGYSAREALGRNPSFLASGLEDRNFYAEMWRTVNSAGHWQGEIRDRRKNGEIFPLWLAITAAAGRHGKVENYIAIGSDISARKAAEERIQFLAYHDVLTGLPNRALFRDRLEQAKNQARRRGDRLAILFLDLDRFKNVNDSLGHEAGDELLRSVARRLRGCVRSEDTISRQGGDEFLILVAQLATVESAGDIAAKIIGEFEAPFLVHGNYVHITPSIGIAIYPDDGEETENLVKNADAAMYVAKERGRNNFQYFVAEINARVSARFSMENALRRALDNQEFELYYQPQVNVSSGKVTGVEALLRWHREDRLLNAAEFIAIAEESGLIMPIGEWVLHQACQQAAAWVREGLPPMRMAINLSAAQFLRKGAFDRLRAILASECRDSGNLEMELTEGMIMQEAESSLRNLRSLKEIGVSLAIDDFGTGYSSLNYLRRFPIDRLKVDQSFVRELPTDPADQAVTEAILALARSLHLAVVAEGVETEEEMKVLEGLHCEAIQGYYFSPPRPAAEIAQWCRERMNA